nr:hypothetical protein [Tanacetum cinerariifolium]
AKNKGLIAETYEWDEEEVSSDKNEAIEVKALMVLANEERVFVSKESASNESSVSDNLGSLLPVIDTYELSAEDFIKKVFWPRVGVCSTLLPLLDKLTGAKPVPGPKTIKSNLKSSPTFKAETLKGITLKEPSLAPAKYSKKGSLVSKTSLDPASKLKNVKVDDDPPLAIIMKELNELKLQLSKKKLSHFKNHQPQQVPHNSLQNRYKSQFKISCKLYGENNHLFENCFQVLIGKKCKRIDHKTCDHAELRSSLRTSQHHTGQGTTIINLMNVLTIPDVSYMG